MPVFSQDDDLRTTALYREAEGMFSDLRRPGSGLFYDVTDLVVRGDEAYFAASKLEDLDGQPATRICAVNFATGELRTLTTGPNQDRLPKFSPDGKRMAFLSDRHAPGDFQLYELNLDTGDALRLTSLDGWVEDFHWSPDGRRILIQVAGHGADVTGGQGATASRRSADERPKWMPEIEAGGESFRWRRLATHSLDGRTTEPLTASIGNVWEAAWCGPNAVVAITSASPDEGAWYSAQLVHLDLNEATVRTLVRPSDQIGHLTASPSGQAVAWVEAVCSDRGIVAGEARLFDIAAGGMKAVATDRIDVTDLEWLGESRLLLAGHRGLESVVAVFDVVTATSIEHWHSTDICSPGHFLNVAGLNEDGDFAIVGEGFARAPEIALVCKGEYEVIRSLAVADGRAFAGLSSVRPLRWSAADGIELEGWVLCPKGEGPFPILTSIHGGPVWHWRSIYLGRGSLIPMLMLLNRGFAIFLPNPRGSSGRGLAFARAVKGDLGGADARDLLSGLDALIASGIADPHRLSVTGQSYGGFMTAWLITQDKRFSAAIPTSPHTNQMTQHLLSNIPHFMTLFMGNRWDEPDSIHLDRSPVMHAAKVSTPTLTICGALDRCTPPEEAMQFHRALQENGVRSVLVTYPGEGHGVRNLPAAIDCAARVVGWVLENTNTSKAS